MHGHSGLTIGNRICRVKWSRDRWRHVTPKGQSRDPIIFEVPYLCNGARQTHGYNRPPIGNHPPRVKWSRDWFGHIIAFNSQIHNLIS